MVLLEDVLFCCCIVPVPSHLQLGICLGGETLTELMKGMVPSPLSTLGTCVVAKALDRWTVSALLRRRQSFAQIHLQPIAKRVDYGARSGLLASSRAPGKGKN